MNPTRHIFPSPGFDHYWKHGRGRKIIRKINSVPDKAEIDQHIPKLLEVDLLADDVINEVYFKLGFVEADKMVNTALEKGIDSIDAPQSLKKLFAQAETIPQWLERKKVEAGAAFCRRTGIFSLIVLRNYCLMGGYESSAINKPLIFTGALKKGAAKRMAETIEFWVNVTGEDALERNNIGFKSAIKVRLMHAFARVSILQKTDWKNSEWGMPINMWDMVATNLGFSLAYVSGLRDLGFRPTEEELNGLFHLWKYIGYLLGIPAAYLPDDEETAIRELYKWTITQPPADEDTRSLAHALAYEPMLSSFPKKKWQRKALINIHLAYNHFFLGKRSCKTMGLRNTWINFYPYVVSGIKRTHEVFVLSSDSFRKKTEVKGRKFQVRIKDLFMEGHAGALSAHGRRD
ncbi:MAG TPA: oxygenase MpaB family protein [Bacteroidia bacterium]|nr:oxygenase MpaB family protein [Bacteroidia bacterium]